MAHRSFFFFDRLYERARFGIEFLDGAAAETQNDERDAARSKRRSARLLSRLERTHEASRFVIDEAYGIRHPIRNGEHIFFVRPRNEFRPDAERFYFTAVRKSGPRVFVDITGRHLRNKKRIFFGDEQSFGKTFLRRTRRIHRAHTLIAGLYNLKACVVEERQGYAASVGRKDDLLRLLSARNGTKLCEDRKIFRLCAFS